MNWAFNFIDRLFNSQDHTASVRLVCFCAVVIAALFWLSHGIYKGKGFEPGWNQAFVTLATLVGLVHANGAWAERPINPKGGGPDDKQKEGEQ